MSSRGPRGILVLTGPPCAGKSSVGRRLADDPGGNGRIYLEVDALFSMLLPHSDRNGHDRLLAYDAAHLLARGLFKGGRMPILDTYARCEQRASVVAALSGLPDASLWVVEIAVSLEDAVRRFRERTQTTDLDDDLVRERAEAFPYGDQSLRLGSSDATPRRSWRTTSLSGC